MRLRFAGLVMVASTVAFATALAGSIPPGRQHLLTMEGENTVTFVPQANLPEFKVDYQAKFEYIVDSRYGKEPKPASTEDKDEDDEPTEKPAAKPTTNPKKSKTKAKKAESPASKATGAIDVSLHSSQRTFRQNGQPVVDMKVNRTKFQGKLLPEMPFLNVGANDAPLPIQEIMKGFDVISASILLNDDLKAVSRKYRTDGPQRAITETILSIHAPVPRNADTWESPTQLAMGHGQTAKGILRFVKEKPAIAGVSKDEKGKEKDKEKDKTQESSLVKVKVSGILKAEGMVAGRFIKDGTYTVTGEQTFDMKTHDWIASRWSVAIENELANPAGQPIARAKGTMIVQSKAFDLPNAGANSGAAPAERAGSKP